MRYGVVVRTDIDLRGLIDLGVEAEAAGWDGFFVWDTFAGDNPWVLLAGVAACTERIRLGPMLTPPSRRRPWQLASEAATLDRVSGGRAVLPLGLGAAADLGFARFGEATDRKTRAALLDETLDILDGLWSGQPFSYDGTHYHLRDAVFLVTPVQAPRVPVWVVAAWPRPQSMRRALRCDGVIPAKMEPDGTFGTLTPDDVRDLAAWVGARRPPSMPFDIVMEGETPGADRARALAVVQPWIAAGATWWLEGVSGVPYHQGGVEGMRARIRQGPPGPP